MRIQDNKQRKDLKITNGDTSKSTLFTRFESFTLKFKIIRNFFLFNICILLGIDFIIFPNHISSSVKDIIKMLKDIISQFKLEMSWPFIVLLIVFLFRKVIICFIDRFKYLKIKDVELKLANKIAKISDKKVKLKDVQLKITKKNIDKILRDKKNIKNEAINDLLENDIKKFLRYRKQGGD